MTYIDYLNRFNQFLESSVLPPSAQLLYYKLLHIFNRAGWPPTVGVDNQRMMALAGLGSEPTLRRARSKLCDAGFIRYQSGKKGSPNRYALCEKALFYKENVRESVGENVGESVGESVGENVRESVRENVRHIKNKTKNKTKTSPPKPPKGASVGSPSYDIDELAALAVLDLPEEL